MRFISMVKFAEAKAVPPSKAFLEAMGQLTQDAAKAGCVMVVAEGLLATSMGARVRLANSKVTVMDGPFAEAKEVVGGYAIFEGVRRPRWSNGLAASWTSIGPIFQA